MLMRGIKKINAQNIRPCDIYTVFLEGGGGGGSAKPPGCYGHVISELKSLTFLYISRGHGFQDHFSSSLGFSAPILESKWHTFVHMAHYVPSRMMNDQNDEILSTNGTNGGGDGVDRLPIYYVCVGKDESFDRSHKLWSQPMKTDIFCDTILV